MKRKPTQRNAIPVNPAQPSQADTQSRPYTDNSMGNSVRICLMKNISFPFSSHFVFRFVSTSNENINKKINKRNLEEK